MGLVNTRGELLLYKVRATGLRNTIRVAYLDLSEDLFYRISKRFPSISFAPRSIQIEITTRCNLKCTFCELSHWTEKPTDLTFETFHKMITRLPKLKRVDLTGIGEALMNRDFFRMVELLKSRRIHITLNDNFTLITGSAARRIVDLGVDQMFLSLDGATKDTYEEIRRGANFEKVIQNVRGLLQLKRQQRRFLPEVKINSVVCLSNFHEMPAIVELAHDLGIGMVVFVNVVTFEGTTDLDTRRVHQEVQSTLSATLQRARELRVLVKTELFEPLPVQQCDYPWKRNFVTHDGYVHPCCHTTQTGDRTALNFRSLGNLLRTSVDEIWTGPGYAAFREKMKRGTLPTQCAHCPKYSGKADVPAGIVS
jgi:pyrroloquinoline quinone biosynthesis protein E